MTWSSGTGSTGCPEEGPATLRQRESTAGTARPESGDDCAVASERRSRQTDAPARGSGTQSRCIATDRYPGCADQDQAGLAGVDDTDVSRPRNRPGCPPRIADHVERRDARRGAGQRDRAGEVAELLRTVEQVGQPVVG